MAPKNILLIGPTGVGKTEIARRLARLVNAPFVKVEATKFTEVGYVGRDVESIIRELVETAVRMVRLEKMAAVEKEAEKHANQRLLNLLSPLPRRASTLSNPFGALLGIPAGAEGEGSRDEDYEEKLAQARQKRELLAQRLQRGELEEELVEIEVEDNSIPS